MQESNTNLQNIEINSDSEESSEIYGIPQVQKLSSSIPEQRIRNFGEYIKVENRTQTIDEQAILELIKKQKDQINLYKNTSKIPKKKIISKIPATPSKKQDLNNIRKKWKAEMDKYINGYKEYLKENKTSLDGKEKEYLLEFYKVLLDGVYELKEMGEDSYNDLTLNQRKIISPEADFNIYLIQLVEKFNQAFRQAKFNNKILHIKDKWDPLIKNCKDQTNLELRRKVIRGKIKPQNVLKQNSEFLMSEQAKIREERRRKLILNEAEKNFQKPLDEPEQGEMALQQIPEIDQLPEHFQSFKSISSNDNLEKRMSKEREKLEEYKQSIGEQPLLRVKKRINDLLIGTSSYNKIMYDFQQRFPNV